MRFHNDSCDDSVERSLLRQAVYCETGDIRRFRHGKNIERNAPTPQLGTARLDFKTEVKNALKVNNGKHLQIQRVPLVAPAHQPFADDYSDRADGTERNDHCQQR